MHGCTGDNVRSHCAQCRAQTLRTLAGAGAGVSVLAYVCVCVCVCVLDKQTDTGAALAYDLIGDRMMCEFNFNNSPDCDVTLGDVGMCWGDVFGVR